MQWLINILAIIVIVVVMLVFFAIVAGGFLALYAKVKHGDPFFKTWLAKFKGILFNLFFEALIPFNWF